MLFQVSFPYVTLMQYVKICCSTVFCTTNIPFATGLRIWGVKHGGDTAAVKSRNTELKWDIRETRKEVYLGNLEGKDCVGELSLERRTMM
jgi:hypothetical protein